MKINLEPKHLDIVSSILRSIIPYITVWAFGSRVKFTNKPHSDLDLVLISEQPVNIVTLSNLQDAFEESNLPFTVDILEYSKLSKHIQEEIEKEYILLQ